MIIINNLFWIGTAIVILAMLRGFGLANNYTSKRAKLICIMHFIGLFMMGYGVSDLAWSYGFQNTWWETGGQALFFILGFGAFLESQKTLPMAPTNIQNMAERVATDAGQVLINSEPEHPAIGSVNETGDPAYNYISRPKTATANLNVSNIQYEPSLAKTAEPADEEIYETALSELDTDTAVSAIYAKALALSQGDTDKARWKYVDLRVAKLKDQEAKRKSGANLVSCKDCGVREPSERLTDGLCVDCVGFRAARLEAEEALENLKGKLSPCKVCGVNELSETLSDGVCLECRRDKKLSSANLNVSNIQHEPSLAKTAEPADEEIYETAPSELDTDTAVSFYPYAKPTKTPPLHDIEALNDVPLAPAEDFAETYREQLALAEQGDADAQFNLGLMHVNGQGVPADYSEGLKWYRLAAEQGDADAQFNLGLMYVNGQGVPLDYSEGVKWYRLAAEQGDADAQTNLGLMHVNGQGVPLNYSEGVKWYRLAAEQGNANAQNNLAFMHFSGQGVPQDFVFAHMWYNLSAAKGNEDGVEGRDLAAAEMTPAAIEEAQRRARVCIASNYQDCD